MPKRTKNRSSSQTKKARQNRARASRGLPATPRLVASPAEARAALEQVATTQQFPMVGTDGQTWQVTLRQISDWHNNSYAAKGEPRLELGELAEILTHDVMFGRLRVRTDGLWESSEPYFAEGADA